jgi:hypothetical protein
LRHILYIHRRRLRRSENGDTNGVRNPVQPYAKLRFKSEKEKKSRSKHLNMPMHIVHLVCMKKMQRTSNRVEESDRFTIIGIKARGD